MTKILGLDLGTNSIGWAVVEKESHKIINAGVRIFPEGIEKDTIGTGEGERSKNASRREHRQSRRTFYRKKLRKIKLLEVLVDEGMCPLTQDELRKWKLWNKNEKTEGKQFPSSPEFINWLKLNPYELRSKALKDNLNLYEFGRILYHLIQRRGFLSSRKSKEEGKIFKGKENMIGIDETYNEIQNETLGSYLFSISYKKGENYYTRKNTQGKEIRVRSRYTLRDMYIREFYEIWKRQAENLILNNRKIKIKKVRYFKSSQSGKKYFAKIKHLKDTKVPENILVEKNKVTIYETKSLFEFLAGKIWEEDGKLKYKSNESVLFWQRPLISQKKLLAKCRFERDIKINNGIWVQKGKTPCPLSHPYFELFRTYQFVNNILYGRNESLNDYQHQKIVDLINSKEKNFDFKEIPKVLDIPDEKFNYDDDQKVPGNPTIKQLKNLFPEDIWNEKMDEIWHCCYFYDDDEKLFEKLKRSYKLKINDIEKIKKIRLVEGYSSVSLKAIRNILPYLKKGYKYNFAVILGGIRNSFGERWENFKNYHEEIEKAIIKIVKEKNKAGETIQKIREYLSEPSNKFGFSKNDAALLKLYHHSQDIEIKAQKEKLAPVDNLRNPIVQQGLHELRRLVNSLLAKYRKESGNEFRFDRINVELGRELKNNKMQRQEQIRLINRNTEKNNIARERLAEYGLKPSRENIHKYLLFREIEDRSGRVQCPYSGRTINVYDLLGPENKIQIEHIIPYSISLDDSLANKTLCEANFNREKGEYTPYQFYTRNPDPAIWGADSWEEIEYRAFRLLTFSKARKFVSKVDFKRDDFIERQLNDTRYISKKAAEMLTEICDDVRVLPGRLTAELRRLWGLNNIIQPVVDLKLEDIQVNDEEFVPHRVLLDENGNPLKIYPLLNQKPFAGEKETIITGWIKNETFSTDNLGMKHVASGLKDGKNWARLRISEHVLIRQVYADKPSMDEDHIIFRGRVEKNYFINDTIDRKIRVNEPDGIYWAKFPIRKKQFEIPEGKQKPKVSKNIVSLYGAIKNSIYKSYIYSCNTNLSNGKYWALIEIESEKPDLFRAVNEKPKPGPGQLLIVGTVDESGSFVSDVDVNHKFTTELRPGKYWIIFNIDSDHIDFYPIENDMPEKLKGQEVIEGNIWVDKNGEIRFDPKKSRDDQRHHAIDAITIAFTELNYLNKLSSYNAMKKSWERGLTGRPDFIMPWNNFEQDVKKAVENILISYRQNNQILTKILKEVEKDGRKYKSSGYSARGQLHRETYFGRYSGYTRDGGLETDNLGQPVYYYHIRKNISEIKTHKQVEKIVDDGIKNLIKNRLREKFGFDTDKPYNIPDNFFFDENKQSVFFLPNKHGEPVPVKKVRLREFLGNAVQLKSNLNQWVNPYNNHHVLIYRDHSGELKEDVVSFWTVIERQQQGLQVYQLPEDGIKLIEKLHENDLFLLGLSSEKMSEINFNNPDYSLLSRYLYRVQKISSMYYTFRNHLAANIDNEKDEIRIQSYNAWLKYNPVKVRINIIGELELIN
nr:CRISPR-associated protein Cas9 [uncultured bacterium]